MDVFFLVQHGYFLTFRNFMTSWCSKPSSVTMRVYWVLLRYQLNWMTPQYTINQFYCICEGRLYFTGTTSHQPAKLRDTWEITSKTTIFRVALEGEFDHYPNSHPNQVQCLRPWQPRQRLLLSIVWSTGWSLKGLTRGFHGEWLGWYLGYLSDSCMWTLCKTFRKMLDSLEITGKKLRCSGKLWCYATLKLCYSPNSCPATGRDVLLHLRNQKYCMAVSKSSTLRRHLSSHSHCKEMKLQKRRIPYQRRTNLPLLL